MESLNLPVEEFTTPNPITVQAEAGVDELKMVMKENGVRHIPVLSENKVVGIISERDLRLISGLTIREMSHVRAADIMVPNPVTVSSSSSLDEVAFEMSKGKIGSVLVNDENDEFLGIFTVTDALNALIELVRSERNKR